MCEQKIMALDCHLRLELSISLNVGNFKGMNYQALENIVRQGVKTRIKKFSENSYCEISGEHLGLLHF